MKAGYRKTEVGVIPEDWSEKSIRQFATIKTGPFGTLLKASEYSEGDGVPLISVSEIREGFLRVNNGTPRVSETVTRRLPQYVLRRGDIVFGRKGAVERSALIRREEDGWFLGSDGISIRPAQDCHDEYLAFQFQSARVRGWLIKNAIGTTMPSLNQEVLRNVVIPFPPTKAEQEAIAEALSDADALIESLEQLLAKKRQIKQGAMQELLTGKKRLPGFEKKHGIKQTEVGLIAEDWSQATIRDIAIKVGSGVTPTGGSKRYKEYGRPFVRSQNVGWGKLLLDDLAFIDEETHNGFPASELKRGDVLLNITGASIGRTALANGMLAGGNVNQHVCIVRSDANKAVPKFINLLLLSALGQRQIDSFQAGGNRQGLNFSQINSIKLPLPPTKAEQEAIAAILSDMDAELAALEAKLAKARLLKQGMMQELLTGRIRLV